MAYDVDLAGRVRDILAEEPRVTEESMFGGLGFLIDGHLALAASSEGGLLLRVDPIETEGLISTSRASRFFMRGRELEGWIRVHLDASATDDELRRWVQQGIDYTKSLPPKTSH